MKKILKSLIILTVTALAVLSVSSCFAKPDTPDTGDRLSGTYEWTLGSSVGSSTYTFNGNRVVNEYWYDSEQIVIEYTYVIAIDGGAEVIRLTDLSTGQTAEYDFAKGNGYIEISGQRYDLVEEK